MKRFVGAAIIIVLAVSAFHLSQMGAMRSFGASGSALSSRMDMPECPMGFVCPMHFETFDSIHGLAAPANAVGLAFFAFAAALLGLVIHISGQNYSPPPLVRINTGPLLARTVVKRE